jgi:hypothetical protein
MKYFLFFIFLFISYKLLIIYLKHGYHAYLYLKYFILYKYDEGIWKGEVWKDRNLLDRLESKSIFKLLIYFRSIIKQINKHS